MKKQEAYSADDDNAVHCLKVLQLMCDQHSSFSLQEATDTVMKQGLPHMNIHSRQWVIQQVQVCLLEYSPVKEGINHC
jgi:hypothetical protein